MTSLEQAIPVYDFRERHQRWIHADPDRIWQSLTTLTLDELAVTRPLMAIRHAGRRSSAPSKPLFTDGPVRMLEIASPAYAVGGAITRAWQLRPARHEVTSLEEFIDFDEPGWIKFLTDFQLQPGDAGTQLSTETRGQPPTSAPAVCSRRTGQSSGPLAASSAARFSPPSPAEPKPAPAAPDWPASAPRSIPGTTPASSAASRRSRTSSPSGRRSRLTHPARLAAPPTTEGFYKRLR